MFASPRLHVILFCLLQANGGFYHRIQHETSAIGFSRVDREDAQRFWRSVGEEGFQAKHRDSRARQPPRPRQCPGSPRNWAAAHGLRYDYAGAERCFEKAIRVAPKKTEAMATAAHACTDFGSPQMAEGYFERAVKQNDASPELFARMAELYEHLARVDEARALVDRALHLDSPMRAGAAGARATGSPGRPVGGRGTDPAIFPGQRRAPHASWRLL
jgi:tetratricopeptide (TPR) repeat protein